MRIFSQPTLSNPKDLSSSQKLSKGGIPLANGDALLPKPPPWAYPLWTVQEVYRNSNDRMSSSTAQAIDQAMTHLSEAKVKFVSVKFSVEKLLHSQSEDVEIADSGLGIHCSRTQSTLDPMQIESKTHQGGDTLTHASRAPNGYDLERVRVVLTADPGVRMDDIEDQGPPRRKEHRRVPSTVAMEEVKVDLWLI